MNRPQHALVAALLVAIVMLVPGVALANPKPLPFTYTFPTLAAGDYEIEVYGDLTPVKALSTATGAPELYLRSAFQLEVETGLTDHLELGLYAGFAPSPGDALASTSTVSDGFVLKQRLRGRFAEVGDWPVDLSLYGEVVENQREIELEAKVNLERRLGPVSLVANLSQELELYFDGHRDFVLNPSAGITYEAAPFFTSGIEYWTRVEFPDFSGVAAAERPASAEVSQVHYLGPTVLFQTPHVWWTSGLYWRLSELGEPLGVGGDFGKVWVRTIIGISP
jgi:hypothetical protein